MYTHSGLWAVNADKAGDTAYSASSFDEEIESMARLYERQELISNRGSRTSDDSFSFARGIRARTESSIGVLRSESVVLLSHDVTDMDTVDHDTPIVDPEPASILIGIGGWTSCISSRMSDLNIPVQDQAPLHEDIGPNCAKKITRTVKGEEIRSESYLFPNHGRHITEGSDSWLHVEKSERDVVYDAASRVMQWIDCKSAFDYIDEITSESPTAW